MATVSVQKLFDQVSLVFACDTDEEAAELYTILVSQALDGKTFHIDFGPSPDEEDVQI